MIFNRLSEYVRESGAKGVVFDLYGTLLHKPSVLNPYKSLLGLLQSRGTVVKPLLDAIMTQPMTLDDVIQVSGVIVQEYERDRLYSELEQELASIAPYPDSQSVIDALRASGIPMVVCSNLALPYEQVAFRSLSGVDAWVMSFRVGFKKPDPRIYELACHRLGLAPCDVLMVGDSLKNDVLGPRSVGMQSVQIKR